MGKETYTGDVAFEVRGHLGIITLNRPKAMNSLTQLMCESVLIQLQDWAEDDDVAQVLVRGAGERGLCAGGDIVGVYRDMLAHRDADGGELLPSGTPGYQAQYETEAFWATEYEMNLTIAEYPKPYIALMDGLALGGGLGISAHGSHRIVTERTRAGMPEVTIGFSPDVGGTYLLARAPGQLGLHAGLQGAHLGAADAIHLGLADAHVDSEAIGALITDLVESSVDEVLPRYATAPEPSGLAAAASWIDEAYAAADVPAIIARLEEIAGAADRSGAENAAAGSPGGGTSAAADAAAAAAALRTKSPTSLAVAHRAIVEARDFALDEVLKREYTVGMHMLRSADFREGIRAQVIDKDRDPQWNPATSEQVDRGLVDAYFTLVQSKQLELPAP